MVNARKKLVFWTVVLAFVFTGIYVLASSRNSTSKFLFQEKPKTSIESAADPQVHELMQQISDAFETASARVSSSVVPIFAEQVVQVQSPFGMPDDPFKDFFGEDFFKRFFGTPQEQEERRTVRSLGSGVIVTKDGYILTNNHVVEKAQKLSVVIGDKKTYQAKVVGTDPPTDVAVIKIDAHNLPVASLGDSDRLKVGQWVIAVGNPFQLMHTVTAGIISAKGRSSVGLADYEDFIQTDASINPGNSGGALADLEGRVIGVNTAITSPSGGNIGIGFAIPINMAKQVMNDLISKGKVVRGYVGLLLQDIDENLAKALGLKGTEGALVADVVKDGPADHAGIKRGDVITAIDGKKIENGTELKNMVAMAGPKKQVEFGLLRNGHELKVRVTLVERPKDLKGGQEQQEPQQEELSSRKLGLSIQTLTPDIAQQLGYQDDHGVVVADVQPGSPADDAGLQRGDLIKEINRKEVRSTRDFEREVKSLKSGDVVAMLVRRGPNTFFSAIKIQ